MTIAVKTFGKMRQTNQFVDSVRKFYPYIPIILTDDGLYETLPARFGKDPNLVYKKLPFDTGLSRGRNIMVDMVTTEYLVLMDDDFLFDVNTDIDYLLDVMEHTNFDILGFKNPEDHKRWKFDFCGKMEVENETLFLKPGSYGRESECDIVDFVPNLFLARTESLKKVRWDERLKLGEHEEFFWRAKHAGIKVGTCPAVSVFHTENK